MTVFKAQLLILKQKLPLILIYLCICLGVTLLNSNSENKGDTLQLDAKRTVKVAIFNESKSPLARGLETFLDQQYERVTLENEEAIIREAIYYRKIHAVITIPNNFESLLLERVPCLDYLTVPGTTSTQMIEMDSNTYLNQLSTYLQQGYSQTEAMKAVDKNLGMASQVNKLDSEKPRDRSQQFWLFFSLLPYLYLTSNCYSISTIFTAVREKEVKRRTLCAAYSQNKIQAYTYLAMLSVGVLHFLVSIGLPLLLDWQAYTQSQHIWYYYLNIFVFIIVTTSMGFLMGMITQSRQAINGIINVLSLAGCFFGGVFVARSFMGERALAIGKFIPTYWYTSINELLGETLVLTNKQIQQLYVGYGIQVLFAMACFCVALVVAKTKEK